MKATGIVRRIDDLGRVVIPKEIRRTLRIRVGEPLEIYTDNDGEVILKKYSPMGEMGEIARQFAESLHRVTGHTAIICDREIILAVSGGSKKKLIDQEISDEMDKLITDRKILQGEKETYVPIIYEPLDEEYFSQTIVPVISEGEPIGAIILLGKEAKHKMGEVELKVCQTASNFIGQQMEQ